MGPNELTKAPRTEHVLGAVRFTRYLEWFP